ncbi:MAG TPA: hypothetical protein VK306_07680 [Acidimicrobiales bacterium]|nr:hypothetical protein [Acidimicrobiales bacterium]
MVTPAARPLPARPGRCRRTVAAILALGIVAFSACSGGSGAEESEPEPTFARASGSSLRFEEPVATVSDLQPPTKDDQPWTIAGSVFDPATGTSVATTWRSPDGGSWEREDVRPGDSDVSEAFSALTTSTDGRVAVGYVGDGAASDAAVWREGDDGWTRVPADALGGDHEQWAFDVAAGESGTVVIGGESVYGEVRGRVWFSADGESWSSVDGGPGGVFDSTGQESIRKVTAFAGGFVAVGSRTVDSEQDGVAWFSPDGSDWTEIEAPSLGGTGRQSLLSVVEAGDVLVAGGYASDLSGQGKPVVWRSSDGKSWGAPSAPLALHNDPRSVAADLSVRSLSIGNDGGIVAVGGADWRPHMWRSADAGVTWNLMPNPVDNGMFDDGVALDSGAERGGTTLALGLEPTVLRLAGDRWEDATGDSFPDGGVQPFATSVAESSDTMLVAGGRYTSPKGDTRERYVGEVWRAGDDGWTALESDKLRDGQIMDVTAYKGGFVAVGFEDFGLADQRLVGDKSPDGLLWTSPDGEEWNRIAAETPQAGEDLIGVIAEGDGTPEAIAGSVAELEAEMPRASVAPAGGEGTRSLEAVAPLGDGFIAVGVACCEDPGEPIVVVSPDGNVVQGEDSGLGGPGTQRFRDVCVTPGGNAVAVGISGTDGDFDAAIRHRDRRGRWSEATVDDDSFGGAGSQQVYGCAASREGFVAVGSDDRSGDADARVWVSEDGVEWTRVTSGLLGGSGDQWASAAAAVPDGGGWLIGGTDTARGDGDIALWRLDGSDLARRDRGEPELSGPGEQSVTSLMVDDRGVVIVGDDYGRVGLWQSDVVDR